jgi:predicted metal-dependent hydrolase
MKRDRSTPEPYEIPRFVPDEPFPPYSYVPGRFPHPTSDPAGHSFGAALKHPSSPDPNHWETSRDYLYGVDLFNHGYYWEAHEVWEGLWHACGRAGLTGWFVKGLIKLAAAGVKAREGKPEGVRSHAHRAKELFQQVTRQLGPAQPHYMGLSLSGLIALAVLVNNRSEEAKGQAGTTAMVVFPFILFPHWENGIEHDHP